MSMRIAGKLLKSLRVGLHFHLSDLRFVVTGFSQNFKRHSRDVVQFLKGNFFLFEKWQHSVFGSCRRVICESTLEGLKPSQFGLFVFAEKNVSFLLVNSRDGKGVFV